MKKKTETDNIIKIGPVTAILNGGNALPGCPDNWDDAKIIEEQLNAGKEEEDPQWKFDCGFKLDFDGRLLSVSSRFYPPKTHYGPSWDGRVTIYLLGEQVAEQKFDCKSLEELKIEVEKYVNGWVKNLKDYFKPNR